MKKLLFLTLISFTLLNLFSACTNDDDATTPNNVLTDEDGIDLFLSWNEGDPSGADVDLYLLDSSGNEIDSSTSGSSFEDLSLSLDDGTYTIAVEYYDGSIEVDYALSVTGQATRAFISFSGSFADTEGNETRQTLVTFTKTESIYVFN